MATIKYCDDKPSGARVVTFDDGVKASCFEKDRAGNRCSFWDDLYVGAVGDYQTKAAGAFTNLTGWTLSGDAPTKEEAKVQTDQDKKERERQIITQAAMKVCAECAQAKDPAAALEFVLGNYQKLVNEVLDPFA